MRDINVGSAKSIVRAAWAAGFLATGSMLGGCGSVIADLPVVGLPADAPRRPSEPRAFLPVHDMPASANRDGMTSTEQARIQAELIEARARSAAAAAAK